MRSAIVQETTVVRESTVVQEAQARGKPSCGRQAMRPAGEREPLKVALLGCGVVGSQVYRLLTEQSADLKARAGAPLEIAGVAVRDPSRPRDVPVASRAC